jgi:hypothetical protein
VLVGEAEEAASAAEIEKKEVKNKNTTRTNTVISNTPTLHYCHHGFKIFAPLNNFRVVNYRFFTQILDPK